MAKMDIAAVKPSPSTSAVFSGSLNAFQFEKKETHLYGWPPKTFGSAPRLRKSTSPLESENIYHLKSSPCYTHRSDNVGVRKIIKCPLLLCWAAQAVSAQGNEYLTLPPTVDENGVSTPTNWIDDGGLAYPSDSLFVRQSYKDIADMILEEAIRHPLTDEVRMILSGTSGTGKSFFVRVIIWKLLHPPVGVSVPDTIIWRHKQAGTKGCMYHLGHFYMIDDIAKFIASTECGNLVDDSNAWIIYDGDAPQDSNFCRTLVISSPGNLYNDAPHVKQFRKSAFFKVYLPPWSLQELVDVSRYVYGVNTFDEVIERYTRFGGVARYILQPGFTIDDPQKTDPIKEALNPGSVVQAIAEFESGKVDATKSSGVLVHLVPDESYRVYTYEWGSTYIMQRSFEELFKVSRRQIETMLVSAEKLHVGTFYGILFEPWFHKRIAERGYTGRMRKLSSGRELTANKKRPFFGINKDIDPLQTQQYTIPRSPLNQFFLNRDIVQKAYNVPSEPNYPSVDSLYPSRGELFQVTSAGRHPIKTDNLSSLCPYFSDYLSRNDKVKFIFVVPPHLFETFTVQPFHDPESRRQEKREERKSGSRVTSSSKGKEHKIHDKEDTSTLFNSTWLEQYVLELDVNPLTEALRKKLTEGKQDKKPKTGGLWKKRSE